MIASIREYFLLSDASATAKVVPEDTRALLHKRLSLGRQRSEAADALWSNGHVAEGLRLAGDAFEVTLEALTPFEAAVAPADEAAVKRIEAVERQVAEDKAEEEAKSESASEAASESEAAAESASESEAEPESAPESESASESASESEAASESVPEPEPKVAVSIPDTPVPSAPSTDPTWAAALRQRGLSESKTREVVAVERALRSHAIPLIDGDVSASDGELFQRLVSARRSVDRVLSPVAMTPRQLTWTRLSRIGFAALILLGVATGTYLIMRPASGARAAASAIYNAEFTANKAIDGDEATEWLLPNGRAGWIDVIITPPEQITTLRLKNSHNRHYNDRATNEYTVEVFSGGRVARTLRGRMALSPNPGWTEHAIDVADVERIRINVSSWHRAGGGLAEIEWE